MKTIGDRIKFFRGQRKMTQAGLAKAAGVSQPVLVDLEAGRQITSKKLPAIAKALAVKIAELDPEYEREYVSAPARIIGKVKVVGQVQAGVWTEIEDYEDSAFANVEVPTQPGLWSHLPQFSYFVRGKSMDLDRIADGDYVICVRYFDAREDLRSGDRVIVERVRNSAVERTVKRLEVSGKTARLIPASSDPRLQKPLTVQISKEMRDEEGAEVRIVGLVIGRWAPF